MKYYSEKKILQNKFCLLFLIVISIEVHSLDQKINLELNNLSIREKYSKNNLIKRNEVKRANLKNEKNDNKIGVNDFRFKSTLNLNMKDGDENTTIVTNSIITADKKLNSKTDDQEIEVIPNSAEAGSEFSWGFLFWSFMNFGAENAISGHSGYWLSKANVKHDYWQAVFPTPQIIDSIQISWRLPPKRLKLFYKLDENSDWIGATEVFIKEQVKDSNGNIITDESTSSYNTIYFRKPLICTRIKIMMNQPIKNKSFSISSVTFYNKVQKGIIKAPMIEKNQNFCWFINTNLIRKNVPVWVYPCLDAVSIGIGTELFQINTNKQIKPYMTDLCVGYKNDTKEVILCDCQEEGSAYIINYNMDYSMYFVGMQDTSIAVDNNTKYKNFIDENTEIIASSEADKIEFRKENILIEGGNYWASEPGQTDVTLQILFGKISCKDCNEDGAYESRKIDMIKINWVHEPKKFNVFIWNPGYSWKNIASFENNNEKVTHISLIGDTAAGLMIRMVEGNKYENIGNMVSYGIKSVFAGFKGFSLTITPKNKKPISKRYFDFEAQNYLIKKNNNQIQDNLKTLGQSYEKSINSYKTLKNSIGTFKRSKSQGADLCKKIIIFNDLVGLKAIEKLKKFEAEILRNSSNQKFWKYLQIYGGEDKLSSGQDKSSAGSKNFGSNEKSLITVEANEPKNDILKSLSGLMGDKPDNRIEGIAPKKILSQGTSSKSSSFGDTDITSRELGSKEFPANNCVQIKAVNQTSLSGFYYIQPECSSKPLRVFCDFTIYSKAIDIYLFKDDSVLNTPNLSNLNIKNQEDIRNQCAKIGLYPIEIMNKDVVHRIHNLIIAGGMELSFPYFVPLGYDYTCKSEKCSKIFNSINSEKSKPIMNFFDSDSDMKNRAKKGSPICGLGNSDAPYLVYFDPKNMIISSLVCSTNEFQENSSKINSIVIDCEATLLNNLDQFNSNLERVFICSKNCQNANRNVYGSGTYHSSSSICKAAIHAGEISGNGGKVLVRIQNPQSNYPSSTQNGVPSSIKSGDGLKAFILYKYKPNCPQINMSLRHESSFIAMEEKTSLDKNKRVDLNNLNVNILIDSILNNIPSDKNTELSKKILLLKSLLPNQNSQNSNSNEKNNMKKNYQQVDEKLISNKLEKSNENFEESSNNVKNETKISSNKDDISTNSEINMIKTNKLDKNSEIFKEVRFFEKINESLEKSNEKLSNQITNKLKAQAKSSDVASSLMNIAGNSPSNLISESAANLANSLGPGAINYFKNLLNNPTNYNPNEVLAAQNQQIANQNQNTEPGENPLSGAGNADEAAGRYSPPNTMIQNSISIPSNNPNTGNAGANQFTNVGKAGGSSQKYIDPSMAMNSSPSADLANSSHPSHTSGIPENPVALEGDLPGQKTPSNPNGMFDLSQPMNKVVDPNETKDDKDGSNGDIPNNGFNTTEETTDKAKNRIKHILNSSIIKDLNKIKEKSNKVQKAISTFSNALSQATNSESDGKGQDISSDNKCNINNAKFIFKRIIENKQNMNFYIERLNRKANSKIYNLGQIKKDWKNKMSKLSSQEPTSIDYSKYTNEKLASDDIFKNIFKIIKLNSDDKSNQWGLYNKLIKTRPRALGIEFGPTAKSLSSMIMLKGKSFYDFKLRVDVLITNSGTVGIIFRAKDRYNYYAFIIDKNTGNKAIAKVINGEFQILKKISDGGISINQWYTITIKARANRITIYMYDSESANKAQTEKKIIFEDYIFVKGSVGILTNGVKGLYFDNFSVAPLSCWTPWIPKGNLLIRNPNSNIYREDFSGTLEDKYEVHNLDENEVKDGPAIWSFIHENLFDGDYIRQSTPVYDISGKKRTNFITLKDKNFVNGIYLVEFIPFEPKGIVSIIFKYHSNEDSNKNNRKIEEFYSFELNNEHSDATFNLKSHINNDSKLIGTMAASQIKELKNFAYMPNKLNTVIIESINDTITIKLSQDHQKLHDIINIVDNTITFGTVGIGTYKTSVSFMSLNINPPKLRTTPNDIDKILNSNIVEKLIPMPSPWKIKEAAGKSDFIKGKLRKDNTAMNNLMNQISILGSVLGHDFKSVNGEGNPNNNHLINFNNPESKNPVSINSDYYSNRSVNWKQCILSRTESSRRNYCENEFSNVILKEKCQNDFCNTCCGRNVSSNNLNILHMCKKSCYKANIASENNQDYKNICISNTNSQNNVYEFCEIKMKFYNQKFISYCKLDMCNLCCVGMDAMKKKNYSFSNLRNCFNDCSKEYNDSNLLGDNLLAIEDKEKDPDFTDINKNEQYESLEFVQSNKRTKIFNNNNIISEIKKNI